MSSQYVGTETRYLLRVFKYNPRDDSEYLANVYVTPDDNLASAMNYYDWYKSKYPHARLEIIQETHVILKEDT